MCNTCGVLHERCWFVSDRPCTPRLAYHSGLEVQSSIYDSYSSTNSRQRSLSWLVVVVLTLIHRCNALRGHRTGSNYSGMEDYLRRKANKQKVMHSKTETNRTPQTKIKP